MTTRESEDLLLRSLSHLPAGVPDAARAERVRAKCRSAMRTRMRAEERRERARRVFEPVVVGVFSAVYFIALVRDVLRTYRWL